MSIPMVNLTRQYQKYKTEFEQATMEVWSSGGYILGQAVTEFEQKAAEYCGVKHAIGVASGTDALHLSLRAAGIGADDEVITTVYTFIGTAEAVSYVGAKPVFVDIDPQTFNIDIEQLEQAITTKTKAVILVHLFGQPIDTDRVKAICDKHNLLLVEDCAHAFGADYQGKKVGSLGDLGCFSFYPGKNLGCFGDGGLITTSNDEYAESLRALRNHGIRKPGIHSELGYNSRLDSVQAAILLIKLAEIDQWNQRRRDNAALYSSTLDKERYTVPHEDGIGTHVYHQYGVRCQDRDKVIKALEAKGIAYGVHYWYALHQQPVYQNMYKGRSFPVAEKLCQEILCLPMCPELTADEAGQVCETLNNY